MKATIENPVVNGSNNVNHAFILILNNVVSSNNYEELRNKINNLPECTKKYFIWGFGRGHIWVKQLFDGEPRQQVIFATF